MPNEAVNDRLIRRILDRKTLAPRITDRVCAHCGGQEIDVWRTNEAGRRWLINVRPEGNKNGYCCVGQFAPSGVSVCRGKSVLLHRVIWVYAHGVPADPTMVIDHVNGIKTDNCLSNLRIVTPAVNVRSGRKAKLTAEDVIEIHAMRERGITYAVIAVHFGVSQSQILKIASGKNWSDIGNAPADRQLVLI
jgi:hypothetical protein